MSGSYDLRLVLLSYLIAAIASFITQGYAQHLHKGENPSRSLWFAMGGRTLGSGIWSMHFIGVLAIVMACFALWVIAEGAEDEYHIEFLKAHHCDEAQGFYYSKPLPADEFSDYYRSYSKTVHSDSTNEAKAGSS